MPAAGVAYDGSVWVTAVSSVALVAGTVGMVAAGGILAAKRAKEGLIQLPGQEAGPIGVVGSKGRSQPLEKPEAASTMVDDVPPGPDDVDRFDG
ncbi:hypothetical protein PSENEW3_00001673 [Picochlorum sp. SENEW3]|nr:hypothetical protein PSENEW3_00001673 [Picochlorum sp. SENEW3]